METTKDLRLTPREIFELWAFLPHGDQDHQVWLLEALVAFSEGRERPTNGLSNG